MGVQARRFCPQGISPACIEGFFYHSVKELLGGWHREYLTTGKLMHSVLHPVCMVYCPPALGG